MKGRFHKNIKAFTVMELVIGMLLASITVAAGFSMYLSFVKVAKKHNEEQQRVKALQAFYFTLENDIQKSEKIIRSNNGFILLHKNQSQIVYRLEDTLLLRETENNLPDTFQLNTEEIQFNENNESDFSLIKSFGLLLNWNKTEMKYHWKKEYSPVESINEYVLQQHGH